MPHSMHELESIISFHFDNKSCFEKINSKVKQFQVFVKSNNLFYANEPASGRQSIRVRAETHMTPHSTVNENSENVALELYHQQ